MTVLYRIRTVWSYTPGGPGYTNLYFSTTDPLAAGAQQAATDVQAFWTAVKASLPTAVSVQIDPTVALIEDFSSAQTGELTLTPAPTAVVGTAAAAYAGPAGATVQWNTSSFPFGRRIRGRTYLVPLTQGSYENNGTLSSGTVSTLNAAASALVAAPSNLVVYTRVRPASGPTRANGFKDVTYRAGTSSLVVSANVRDIAAVLRSRRD